MPRRAVATVLAFAALSCGALAQAYVEPPFLAGRVVKKELPPDPTQFSTYAVAHHVGLTLEQEYELLCTFNARSRQAFLLSHLERILPMVRETEMIKQRARMNGHFKNVLPPQF